MHGILANGALWRDVVWRLCWRFRCVMPDLSPAGVARIVVDFVEALDLRDVTLVGNDTGGAICQVLIANHPGRIGRLVLTTCDAYEAFFPALLMPFQYGVCFLGPRFTDLLAWTLRARPVQRVLLWTVTRRRVDGTVLDSYFAPMVREGGSGATSRGFWRRSPTATRWRPPDPFRASVARCS